ncbi:unnamed protein product [Symbiodinium sp. KB8]|nr:unnamed protein product [Symbiodinium sp. KB8]
MPVMHRLRPATIHRATQPRPVPHRQATIRIRTRHISELQTSEQRGRDLDREIEVRTAADGVEAEVAANVIAVASQAIWLGTVQTRAKKAFEKCVEISVGSSPSMESSICHQAKGQLRSKKNKSLPLLFSSSSRCRAHEGDGRPLKVTQETCCTLFACVKGREEMRILSKHFPALHRAPHLRW